MIPYFFLICCVFYFAVAFLLQLHTRYQGLGFAMFMLGFGLLLALTLFLNLTAVAQ